MQYFTLQARSHREALELMKAKYGENARILTHRSVRIGGFMGLFSKEGVEITGYLSSEPLRRKRLEVQEEKEKILQNVQKDQTLKTLLNEIKSLKEELKGSRETTGAMHPIVDEMKSLLEKNEFTGKFIGEACKWLESSFSLEELNDRERIQDELLLWIGGKISIADPIRFTDRERQKIVTIVGPTGVGKTTTVAKLAAIYGIGNSKTIPRKVRMVTIDYYRIAAEQQIKKYGEIMKIPVSVVTNREELKRVLALYGNAELILIDTIGKSPRDYEKLGEMKNILDVIGKRNETYLAVSATTKTSDLEDILRQFEPFDYRSIILTKLDETNRIGNIVSVLSEKGKKISYLSDGQSVPQDFEEATVVRFLKNLEGFSVKSDLLEEKFGREVEITKGIWS